MASENTSLSVSIVICTHGRPDELSRCLESLQRIDPAPFEILVVDNCPGTDRTNFDTATRYRAEYVLEPVLGLSRARNTGAKASKGDIVAYIDDDAIAEPRWIAAIVEEFKDPGVGIVTGPAIPLKVETEGERLADALQPQRPATRNVIDRNISDWFVQANFGAAGDGMNMAFRRECFDRWPGFSERLGRGAAIDALEEHYAFFQLLEFGYKLVYSPEAAVRHPYKTNIDDVRRRVREDIRTASAYMTMLYIEHPAYRRELVDFIFKGTKRRTSGKATLGMPKILPAHSVLMAWLSGPWLYFRSPRPVNPHA